MGICWSHPGKGKAQELDQDKIDKAILDLKVTRDRLTKYQNRQERTRELEIEKARELVQKNQIEKAKIVLRQKKIREKYIENAQKQLENVESMIDNIETKQMEMEMIRNLEATNDILKQMNDLMPVEEVERIMDENEEQAQRLNEISDLLTQNMSQADNDAAEEEYEQLLAELEKENGGDQAEIEQEEDEAESEHESENKEPITA